MGKYDSEFWKRAKRSSEEVSNWPEWKQDAFGAYTRLDNIINSDEYGDDKKAQARGFMEELALWRFFRSTPRRDC